MRTGRTTLIAIALLALGATSVHAEESGWSLRFNGTWTAPEQTNVDDSDPAVRFETTTGETFGLGLGLEYRFSKRVGLEFGAQVGYDASMRYKLSDPEGKVFGDPLDAHPGGDMRFVIYDAALNIYVAAGQVEVYVGPVIGYITYDDVDVRLGSFLVPATVLNDSGGAVGGVLGLDIPFSNSHWFLTSSVRYLVASYDSRLSVETSTRSIDFDPFIARLGLGYRF